MTLIFIFVFTFNFKEFFYQHEKYGIDDNFNETNISFVKPSEISYELTFKNIKEDKDNNKIETNFYAIVKYQKEEEKDFLIFKDIKQTHKINKKEFINKFLEKRIKKDNKKEVVYQNGIFHIKEGIKGIDKSIFDLLFINITFPQKIDVGYLWSIEKEKMIKIDNYNYHYKEKYFIKFLGYRGNKLIFKVNYFLDNDSLIEKKIINSYGEIILTINNHNIESIDGKIQMLENGVINKITFSSKIK